jgi:hypothetical protein
MKNAIKSVIVAAALSGGMLEMQAATAAKTNWVQTVDVKLEVFQGSSAKGTALTTKSIVTALGGGATAKLVVKQAGTNTLFLLRTGTTSTDVTSHFTTDNGTSVSSTAGGVTTRHGIDTYHFTSATLNFDVSGLTTETRGPAAKNGPVVTKSLKASVAGDGIVGTGTTKNAVMSGTIATSGGRLE